MVAQFELWLMETPNQKRRPVLIVSRDEVIPILNNVVVAPVTSIGDRVDDRVDACRVDVALRSGQRGRAAPGQDRVVAGQQGHDRIAAVADAGVLLQGLA